APVFLTVKEFDSTVEDSFPISGESKDNKVTQEFGKAKQEISSTPEDTSRSTGISQDSDRSPGEQREQEKKPEAETKPVPEKRVEREVRDNVVAFSRNQEIDSQNRRGMRSGRAKRNGHDEKKGSSKIIKAAGIMGNVVFGSLLVVMAVLAFFLVQSKMHGGIPSIAGYQMYVALSGSMNPAFDTGSLVFIRETDPTNIAAGDIITFKGADSDGMLTTHRVVEVNTNEGLTFTTRGDANNVNDPMPVPAENLVGRVHGSVPYMGYVMGFAQTRQGLIFLIFIPGFLVIAYELRNIYAYLGEMERENKSPQEGVSQDEDKKSTRKKPGTGKVINS
ncbi:MAG: signal peptidase I, partial [Candidatus Contubernalis sp.]|nr:signal peptidase I [Candidatus Contubernalis sp.]